jgi:hypothetical protein
MLAPLYCRLLLVILASGLLLDGFVAWKDSALILKGYPDFAGLYADAVNQPGALSRWLTPGQIGVLFSTPLLVVLWLRLGRLNLLVPILALWLYGIAKEVSGTRTARLQSECVST